MHDTEEDISDESFSRGQLDLEPFSEATSIAASNRRPVSAMSPGRTAGDVPHRPAPAAMSASSAQETSHCDHSRNEEVGAEARC